MSDDERAGGDDSGASSDAANVPDDDLGEAAVAAMVRECRPDWRLREYERAAEGTDFVARVDCETPVGDRRAVLKATTAGFVRPEVARAEPRLYDLVGRETSIPVPEVYGAVDDHPTYPAPFYLLEYVEGTNVESDPGVLSPAARERTCREAGRNLAELHELRTFESVGSVGVREDELVVVPNEDGVFEDGREWFRQAAEGTVQALTEGTHFPEMADRPDRFADLAEPLREAFERRVEAMPDPAPPRFCHWDYRWGNLLVDVETGATRAVLDWANLSTTDPAYNLATAEYHLLDAGDSVAVERHRTAFREAYARGREGWRFDDDVAARMETYRLLCRADAMACLPLWHAEKSAEGKARVERIHREAVAPYLD